MHTTMNSTVYSNHDSSGNSKFFNVIIHNSSRNLERSVGSRTRLN